MIYQIVAMDENNLIGQKESKNGIPWQNKEDLMHFKKTTLHQDILMGRTTFEAIGKALPHRNTFVLSRQDITYDNVHVIHDLETFLNQYKNAGKDLYICGGARIYRETLPFTDILLVSRIFGSHQGETYFPCFEDNFLLSEVKKYETFNLEIYKVKNKG